MARWGDLLLQEHRSYLSAITVLKKAGLLLGAAHITEAASPITHRGCYQRVWRRESIPRLGRFRQYSANAQLRQYTGDDWRRTFNLGSGMILRYAIQQSIELPAF